MSDSTTPVEGTDTLADGQIILILCGLIGSGKSTFSKALERHFPNCRRCNQDDLGSRRNVETLAKKTLTQGLSVCIDRTNFDQTQREHFINIGRAFPNASIWALVFDTPYEVCASRLQTRTNHPTITSPELGISLLERFASDYRAPTASEGFDRIKTLKPHATGEYTLDDIAAILDDIRNSPPPAPAAGLLSRPLQFFRAGYGSGGRMRGTDHRRASPPSSSRRMTNGGQHRGSSSTFCRNGLNYFKEIATE